MLMLTEVERGLIQDNWRIVRHAALMETATGLFYKELFDQHPEYRDQFPADMAGQIKKLAVTLDFAVSAMNWKRSEWREGDVDLQQDLFAVLIAMGRRHALEYGVQGDQYGPVGAALLHALDLGLGAEFTPAHRAAWTKLYGLIAQTMQLGAVSAAGAGPLASASREEVQG